MSRKRNKYFKIVSVLLIILFAVATVTIGLFIASKLNMQSSMPYTVISEGARKKMAFSGSFSPNYGANRPVFLQVKKNRTWNTVAKSRLNQSGKFNFSVNTAEGVSIYRAAVGNTPLKKLSQEISIATCKAPGNTRTSTSSTLVILDVKGDFPANASQPNIKVEMPDFTEKIHNSKVYRNATPGLWTVSATTVSAGEHQYWPIKSWQEDVNVPKNKCTVIEVNYILAVPTQTIILTPEQAEALIHKNPNYQN